MKTLAWSLWFCLAPLGSAWAASGGVDGTPHTPHTHVYVTPPFGGLLADLAGEDGHFLAGGAAVHYTTGRYVVEGGLNVHVPIVGSGWDVYGEGGVRFVLSRPSPSPWTVAVVVPAGVRRIKYSSEEGLFGGGGCHESSCTESRIIGLTVSPTLELVYGRANGLGWLVRVRGEALMPVYQAATVEGQPGESSTGVMVGASVGVGVAF